MDNIYIYILLNILAITNNICDCIASILEKDRARQTRALVLLASSKLYNSKDTSAYASVTVGAHKEANDYMCSWSTLLHMHIDVGVYFDFESCVGAYYDIISMYKLFNCKSYRSV